MLFKEITHIAVSYIIYLIPGFSERKKNKRNRQTYKLYVTALTEIKK